MSKSIECNSKSGLGDCVAEMDGQQSMGGAIVCDIAEECCFDVDTILKMCPHAQMRGEQNG